MAANTYVYELAFHPCVLCVYVLFDKKKKKMKEEIM